MTNTSTLRETRRRLNLTQVQLAALLGVHVCTLKRWEKGSFRVPRAVELAMREIEREHNTRP